MAEARGGKLVNYLYDPYYVYIMVFIRNDNSPDKNNLLLLYHVRIIYIELDLD